MIRTLAAIAALLALQSQQTPVFRTRADLARLDVIVTDNRTGKPVTDLTISDFTIRENGVPQTIALFVNDPLVPAEVTEASRAVVRGGATDARSRRVFLFYPTVAGSLQQVGVEGPVKPIEGAVRFIREQLLPQDLVGTIAFNRVTDLTTDHEYVARVLERLKQNYQKITFAWMKEASTRRSRCADMSEPIQAMIDALFESDPKGAHHARSLLPFITGTEEFNYADSRLRCGGIWNARLAGNTVFGIYAGIEYLRPVTGQKHLITMSTGFMMPGLISWGLFFRDASEEARLAARANDAQVALDLVDTRGTQAYAARIPPARLSLMNLSALGGGQFTSVRTADDALRRIDAASRHSYLIGYAPIDPALDGKYRKVEVQVNRRDVTVTYRRGYTASADVPPLDLRAIETSSRLREAAATDTENKDIKLNLVATAQDRNPKDGQVQVTLTIDGSRLSFTRNGDKREGTIDVLILCGDKDQNVVGTVQHKLAMSLDDQKYQRAITEGMPYTATIPVTGLPTHVKAVVYDYEADLVGTVVIKLK
jgi:VWFA-related protein